MISRLLFLTCCATAVTLVLGLQIKPLDELCLSCICEASSNCNRILGCSKGVCGIFKITWAYWADANKPTLKFDRPDDPEAYSRCVKDPECAARTVTQYTARFAQDCNNDGIVNCYDYGSIHKLGGYGCKGNIRNSEYYKKLQSCLQKGRI